MRAIIILNLLLIISCVQSARILCVFPGFAHSHHTVGYAFVKALANKGHEVTFVSPFEEKTPVKNLKNVVLTGFLQLAEETKDKMNLFDMGSIPTMMSIYVIGGMGLMLAEETLKSEAMQRILNSGETYDLVITENFLCDSLQAIAYHYKVPSVLVTTIGPSIWSNHIVGAPDIPSFQPIMYLSFSEDKIPFLGRVHNTILTLFQKLYDHLYFYPKHNQLVKSYFPDAPNIYDIVYNTSLMFTNSHVSFNKPYPTTANLIEIGGYHVEEPRKLPEDLQKILDDAKDGVIYFSMGSNLKSAGLKPELRDGILKAFSKLKQKVLWKFEEDSLPGKPDNVIIRKWLPQNDVLAHPNVKIFITHGGLLSTVETIYHGIPIVGIPVFGDQTLNVANAVNVGYAVEVPFARLSEETLSKAINEVLSNPKYAEIAKQRSDIMHDQQVKPVDKIVYWIEYVIRHKGAHHLKSPGLALTSYQYYIVDVVLFLTLVTVILFIVFYLIIKWILGKNKPPKNVKSKVKRQ